MHALGLEERCFISVRLWKVVDEKAHGILPDSKPSEKVL
jgi:hypothetical protein